MRSGRIAIAWHLCGDMAANWRDRILSVSLSAICPRSDRRLIQTRAMKQAAGRWGPGNHEQNRQAPSRALRSRLELLGTRWPTYCRANTISLMCHLALGHCESHGGAKNNTGARGCPPWHMRIDWVRLDVMEGNVGRVCKWCVPLRGLPVSGVRHLTVCEFVSYLCMRMKG